MRQMVIDGPMKPSDVPLIKVADYTEASYQGQDSKDDSRNVNDFDQNPKKTSYFTHDHRRLYAFKQAGIREIDVILTKERIPNFKWTKDPNIPGWPMGETNLSTAHDV